LEELVYELSGLTPGGDAPLAAGVASLLSSLRAGSLVYVVTSAALDDGLPEAARRLISAGCRVTLCSPRTAAAGSDEANAAIALCVALAFSARAPPPIVAILATLAILPLSTAIEAPGSRQVLSLAIVAAIGAALAVYAFAFARVVDSIAAPALLALGGVALSI